MTNENQDIFGNIIERPNKEIGVNLYCDEIKSVRSPVTNDKWHYIVYSDKIFKVDRQNPILYKDAKQYGLSLGIPPYQVDFRG